MDILAFLSAVFAFLMTPPLTHVIFGGLGGIAYCLLRSLDDIKNGRKPSVPLVEWAARVFFGALGAFILTVVLHLPDHINSLFVGYFAIDIVRFVLPGIEARIFDALRVVAPDHADAPMTGADALNELEKRAASAAGDVLAQVEKDATAHIEMGLGIPPQSPAERPPDKP